MKRIQMKDLHFTIVYDDMLRWLNKPAKNERVAALLGLYRFTVASIVPMPNRHPNPADNFRVLQKDVTDRIAEPGLIVGWIHTHPVGSCAPSLEDIQAVKDGTFGIVGQPPNTFVVYTQYGVIGQSIFGRL